MSPSQASETCASASSATSARKLTIRIVLRACQEPHLVANLARAGSLVHGLVSASPPSVAPICIKVSSIHQMTPAPVIVSAVTIPISNPLSARYEDSVSPNASASVRPTTIQSPIARVVAVYELATFPTQVCASPTASAIAMTTTLRE